MKNVHWQHFQARNISSCLLQTFMVMFRKLERLNTEHKCIYECAYVGFLKLLQILIVVELLDKALLSFSVYLEYVWLFFFPSTLTARKYSTDSATVFTLWQEQKNVEHNTLWMWVSEWLTKFEPICERTSCDDKHTALGGDQPDTYSVTGSRKGPLSSNSLTLSGISFIVISSHSMKTHKHSQWRHLCAFWNADTYKLWLLGPEVCLPCHWDHRLKECSYVFVEGGGGWTYTELDSDLHQLYPWRGLWLWVETDTKDKEDNDGQDCRYRWID